VERRLSSSLRRRAWGLRFVRIFRRRRLRRQGHRRGELGLSFKWQVRCSGNAHDRRIQRRAAERELGGFRRLLELGLRSET